MRISMFVAVSGLFLALLIVVTTSVFVAVVINCHHAANTAVDSGKRLLDDSSDFSRTAIANLADKIQEQLSQVVLRYISGFIENALNACDNTAHLYRELLPTLQAREQATNNGSLLYDVFNLTASHPTIDLMRRTLLDVLQVNNLSSIGMSRYQLNWLVYAINIANNAYIPSFKDMNCTYATSVTNNGSKKINYVCLNDSTGDYRVPAKVGVSINNSIAGPLYARTATRLKLYSPTNVVLACQVSPEYTLSNIVSLNIGSVFFETNSSDSLAALDLQIGLSHRLQPFMLDIVANSPLVGLQGAIVDLRDGSILAATDGNAFYQVNATNAITNTTGLVSRQATLGTANSSLLLEVQRAINRTFISVAGIPWNAGRLRVDGVKVNGEEWFVSFTPYIQKRGIQWMVILCVPRSSVLGEVDALDAVQTQKRESSENDVDNRLKLATITSVSVFVAGICLSMLAAFSLASIIAGPVSKLAMEMDLVATLQIEDSVISKLSVLSEVHTMQTAFNTMVKLLRSYKSFLPQTLVQKGEDGDSDEDERPGSGPHGKMSINLSKTSLGSSHESRKSSSKRSSANPASVKTLVNEVGMARRNVTAVAVCLVNFHAAAMVLAANDLSEVIAEMVSIVLEVAGMTRGIADQFDMGRMCIFYNASMRNASHGSYGAYAAYQLSSRMRIVAQKFQMKGAAVALEFGVGMASGIDRCGNMGAEGMKRYQVVGTAKATAEKLAMSCKRMGAANVCALSAFQQGSIHELKCRVMLKKVACVPHVPRPFVVVEVTGKKEIAMEEWMYQLKDADEADEWSAFNTAALVYLDNRGTLESQNALAMLTNGPVSKSSDVSRASAELANLVNSNSSPSLLEIPDYAAPIFWDVPGPTSQKPPTNECTISDA